MNADVTVTAVKVAPRDWYWRAYVARQQVAAGHARSRPDAVRRARAAAINRSGLIGIND